MRLKIGALDQHVLGAGSDLAIEPAHDAGESDALGFVGDHQRFACQLVFLLVERGEFFAVSGIAHDDHRLGRAVRRCEQMVVERVQRLAGLEHHVIGHIDDVVDAADADPLERVAQPTRAGADRHAANDARVVARAVLGIVEPHIDQRRGIFVARRQVGNLRQSKRVAGDRADLAGDADEAVPIRPVRRHFQIVNNIVAAAAQVFGERLADLRFLRQNHQSFGVVGEAKFLRRTHHALRLHAADFADLDLERLRARLGGHLAAGHRQRNLTANLEIRRAADDLPLARTVVHLAERQAVGVRMRLLGEHLGDHDAVKTAGHFLDALDLEADHRQPLGEFVGRPFKVNVPLQPIVSNFHFRRKTGENRDAAR